MNILFICSYNEMRSATAETVYRRTGLCVKSAGTEKSARVPVSEELLSWAEIVFVMEERHRVVIKTFFEQASENKRIEVLNIPDKYFYMDPELVGIIRERVAPYLEKGK